MTFEFGKTYIVDVTTRGIIPREVFDRDRWYNKDHDDLDFLTDEEKAIVVNAVLDKIRAEIDHVTEIHSDGEFYIKNIDVKRIIDKYKAESEEV